MCDQRYKRNDAYFLLVTYISEIIIPEAVSFGANIGEETIWSTDDFFNNIAKYIIEEITLELRDNIQNWIISHPNVIESHDKDDVLKLVNKEHWTKTFCPKYYYILMVVNYTKTCFNLKIMVLYLKYEIKIVVEL